jgi:hypothetical protein
MSILLPPRADGTCERIPDSVRQIVIVGANGAGKTRFAKALAESLGENAYRLSALNALMDRDYFDESPSSVDSRWAAAVHGDRLHSGSNLQLDRVMALLLHDEMLNLIGYKIQHSSNPEAKLRSTRLDKVISVWQELFPDNKVLIESGKFLFTRGEEAEEYSAMKLSAGERAVIYYLGAILYAPRDCVVLVDSPEMFLHPSITQSVWNRIEFLRPDLRYVFVTHDLEFAASCEGAVVVWVRDFDPRSVTWQYEILPHNTAISDELYMTIVGARKPVLFIEGDGVHSIDGKLYPLIFKDYTVQSLGSCNKVIEATRTFNDLNSLHHMASRGIVDRDRRDENEVAYLRSKNVMVPNVAEIENILMLEEVIRTVASRYGKDENKVFEKVSRAVISQFDSELKQQALMHTRHRVKRVMECRIDGRFASIGMLEKHMVGLVHEINPRGLYETFCRQFRRYVETGDYSGVLMVYNQKSMIPGSNVASLCGLQSKEDYIRAIISILREDGKDAARIRQAVVHCFGLDEPANSQPSAHSKNKKKNQNHSKQ